MLTVADEDQRRLQRAVYRNSASPTGQEVPLTLDQPGNDLGPFGFIWTVVLLQTWRSCFPVSSKAKSMFLPFAAALQKSSPLRNDSPSSLLVSPDIKFH